jgi:2-furoyl-CoA dehydrogenase FAD binding subunit
VKPVAFEYCRPDSLAEALGLLEEFGVEAAVLAGGMSLGAMLNMRLVRPAAVVDIKGLGELRRVEAADGRIEAGALVLQAAALNDASFMREVPLLALALPHVGHFQTRNRGTLGGSVAHADPSSEIPLALATLGGEVELASKRGARRVPAREFFVDVLSTARRADELVTAVRWPRRRAGAGYAFDEICQRHGDFAIVAAAAEAVIDGAGALAHLSFGLGGVESRPVVVEPQAYLGRPASARTAGEIAAAAAQQVQPNSDLKASGDFRRALVRELGARVLSDAFARAGSGL